MGIRFDQNFTRNADRFVREIRAADEAGVKAGAQITKDIILGTVRRSGYPRLTMSGFNWPKGGKIGVGYKVDTIANEARGTVRARGPWLGVENDIVNPRGGPSKKTGSTRRGRMARAGAARSSGTGKFRGAVPTPMASEKNPMGYRQYTYVTKRIPGKQAWTRGIEAAAPKAAKAFNAEIIKTFRRSFGG